MTRNLKALGLALMAAFAVGVVTASAASAQQGFLTSTGPVTFTGTEGTLGANKFFLFGLEFSCPGSTLTGHKVLTTSDTAAGKKHELIPTPATELTVTAHTKVCNVFPGSFPATVDMNGCDYRVKLGVTTEATPTKDTYGVTYDVVCPAGKEITLTIFTTAKKHEEEKPFCKVHFSAQTGLAGSHATDTTNGHVDLDGTIKKIKATKTNGGEDPLLCTAQATETAEFVVNVTGTGDNAEGKPTAISLSHL
jgi:hypothetical protein